MTPEREAFIKLNEKSVPADSERESESEVKKGGVIDIPKKTWTQGLIGGLGNVKSR